MLFLLGRGTAVELERYINWFVGKYDQTQVRNGWRKCNLPSEVSLMRYR